MFLVGFEGLTVSRLHASGGRRAALTPTMTPPGCAALPCAASLPLHTLTGLSTDITVNMSFQYRGPVIDSCYGNRFVGFRGAPDVAALLI